MINFPMNYFKKEVRCGTTISETMKRIWAAQMEVLQRISDICDKYNLKYYVYWGTLIGAVRHQGFIPWDDDVDIAMLRDDYIKFLSVAREELPDDYWIMNMYTTDNWENYFSRVTNGNGINLDSSRTKEYHGCPLALGIDIFPLYYIPRDEEIAKNQKDILTIVSQMGTIVDRRYSNLIKMTEEEKQACDLQIAQNLVDIERITGYQFTTDKPLRTQLDIVYDQLCRIGTSENSDYVMTFPHYLTTGHKFRKEIFEPIELLFEGTVVTAPKGYDEILRTMYGDYMTPKKVNAMEKHDAIRMQSKLLGRMLEALYFKELNSGKDLDIAVRTLTDEELQGVTYEEAKRWIPREWLDLFYVRQSNGKYLKKAVILFYESIENLLLNSENVVEKTFAVLEYFKTNTDVVLWWIPYQFDSECMEVMRDYVPEMIGGYNLLLDEYRKQNWGICDTSGDLSRAFYLCDAYFGDEGIITSAFIATKKKLMYQDYNNISMNNSEKICDEVEKQVLTEEECCLDCFVDSIK